MSHPNQPEYFTINSVCPHTGAVTCVGIFEDMDAVSYRLKRMYTSCGDEYHVECHHLSNTESEAEAYNEQIVNRAKYRREEAEKEAKLKEYDEWKGQIKEDIELPDIKAAYKTVGIS
mgnify:CR=1 FL=1